MSESKGYLVIVISVCLLSGATLSSTQRGSAAVSKTAGSSASIPSWQKIFARNADHAVIYQPQLKAWQKYRTMAGDTAISVTETGEKPVLGVISRHTDTITNLASDSHLA